MASTPCDVRLAVPGAAMLARRTKPLMLMKIAPTIDKIICQVGDGIAIYTGDAWGIFGHGGGAHKQERSGDGAKLGNHGERHASKAEGCASRDKADEDCVRETCALGKAQLSAVNPTKRGKRRRRGLTSSRQKKPIRVFDIITGAPRTIK